MPGGEKKYINRNHQPKHSSIYRLPLIHLPSVSLTHTRSVNRYPESIHSVTKKITVTIDNGVIDRHVSFILILNDKIKPHLMPFLVTRHLRDPRPAVTMALLLPHHRSTSFLKARFRTKPGLDLALSQMPMPMIHVAHQPLLEKAPIFRAKIALVCRLSCPPLLPQSTMIAMPRRWTHMLLFLFLE